MIHDESVGIRLLQVTSLPPREQEEDDDIADGYSYTLERIPCQRKWQVLPGSFRIEPLSA